MPTVCSDKLATGSLRLVMCLPIDVDRIVENEKGVIADAFSEAMAQQLNQLGQRLRVLRTSGECGTRGAVVEGRRTRGACWTPCGRLAGDAVG